MVLGSAFESCAAVLTITVSTEHVCLQDGLSSELEQKAKEVAELQTLIATAGEVAAQAQVSCSHGCGQAHVIAQAL